MIYNNKLLSVVLLIFISFSPLLSKAQGPDTLFKVPNNPLIKQLVALKDLNTQVILSPETKIIPLGNTIFAPNGQILTKQGNDIYILISQTGFVYKLKSYDSATCEFKRIDHTVNLNYNIDCKYFIYKGQLYNLGGYGFWKTNGHLRKFNFEDSEWDIIPINKEIFITTYCWYSETEGRIYVPFQRIVNAGIVGGENIRGVVELSSYSLDIEKRKWSKLGDLEYDWAKMIQNDNSGGGFLNLKEGLLRLIHDEAYVFDFIHNKVFKSKNADFNQFLIRRSSFENIFIYNGFIWSYNVGSKTFNKYPFKMSDFELQRTSIWGAEKQLYIIILIVLLIVLIVVTIIWFFNRSVRRKLEVAQLKILKNKSISQAFTGTEVSLIELLLSATTKNESVEIHQINHVLGIKDKNIGLQKKVRSDVINAINDKYEFITQSDVLLIGSSRKEDDKRFFEYFITPTEIKSIQRILENN